VINEETLREGATFRITRGANVAYAHDPEGAWAAARQLKIETPPDREGTVIENLTTGQIWTRWKWRELQ